MARMIDGTTLYHQAIQTIHDLRAEVKRLTAEKKIADALMLEGAQKLDEIRDERDRLKQHVKDLNSDLEGTIQDCNKHHGETE